MLVIMEPLKCFTYIKNFAGGYLQIPSVKIPLETIAKLEAKYPNKKIEDIVCTIIRLESQLLLHPPESKTAKDQ